MTLSPEDRAALRDLLDQEGVSTGEAVAGDRLDLDAASRFLVDGAQLSVIRPGDTLVVRVPRITQNQAASAKASIEAQLPGVTAVVLGVEQMAIFRPAVTIPIPAAVANAEAAYKGCPIIGCMCQACETARRLRWQPTRSGPVGLTADQYKTLPSADQALVDAWMVENGAEKSGCMAIRFDPDGSAHFLQSVTLDLDRPVETWLCVSSPTERPDVAWHPWGWPS